VTRKRAILLRLQRTRVRVTCTIGDGLIKACTSAPLGKEIASCARARRLSSNFHEFRERRLEIARITVVRFLQTTRLFLSFSILSARLTIGSRARFSYARRIPAFSRSLITRSAAEWPRFSSKGKRRPLRTGITVLSPAGEKKGKVDRCFMKIHSLRIRRWSNLDDGRWAGTVMHFTASRERKLRPSFSLSLTLEPPRFPSMRRTKVP